MDEFDSFAQSFESTVSDAEELEEAWLDVEAFAGTLVEKFEGDIKIRFEVKPILELNDNE